MAGGRRKARPWRGRVAAWFGLEAAAFERVVRPLEEQMAGNEATWRRMAERDGLIEPKLRRLASA